MTHENHQFEALFRLWPEAQCVAGGAAARWETAGDIDVWVMWPPPRTPQLPPGATLLWRAGVAGVAYTDQPSTLLGIIEGIWLHPWERKLSAQILCQPGATTTQILATFDLSCHQVAVERDGRVVTLPITTSLDQPIIVWWDNVRDAEATLARYRKLCRRYGLPMDRGILNRLQAGG